MGMKMSQVLSHIELVNESLEPTVGEIMDAEHLANQWLKEGVLNDDQASAMLAHLGKARGNLEVLERG